LSPPAIAREGKDAVARHGGDDPRRRSDLANSRVEVVRNIKIAACIQRDTRWAAEARICRRPPSPAKVLIPLPATVVMILLSR